MPRFRGIIVSAPLLGLANPDMATADAAYTASDVAFETQKLKTLGRRDAAAILVAKEDGVGERPR